MIFSKTLRLLLALAILAPANVYGDVCLAPPLKSASINESSTNPSAARQSRALLQNAYLHTIIGNAIKDDISPDELVDRIIQVQSAANELAGVELASVRKSGDSFYCLFKDPRGAISLKYSLLTAAAPAGVFTIEMSGGLRVAIEEVPAPQFAAPQAGRRYRARDAEQLLKEALSTTGKARRDAVRSFLSAIASCPDGEVERLFSAYSPDLSSPESCYANLLIAGGVLRGLPGERGERSGRLYDTAAATLSSIQRDGAIAKDAKGRIEYYAHFARQMPALYELLGYYRKSVSDNPTYFIEALEAAIHRAWREIKNEQSRREILKTLSASKEDLWALMELDEKSAATGSVAAKEDMAAAVSAGTAKRLPAYDGRDIQHVVKLVSKLYAEERLRVMPDIIFRADAGMVFSYKGVPYVFLSNFRSEETRAFRTNEVTYNREWFRQHKFRAIEVPPEYPFEGSSEIQYVRRDGKTTIIMNQGPRTSPEAIDWIEERIRRIVKEPDGRIEILRTFAVTEELAHLSTCLAAIPVIENKRTVRETVMYYPAAFDEKTQKALRERYPDAVLLSAEDAQNFAAESVVLGDRIIVDDRISAALERELASRGLETLRIDLSEYAAAGGGARSLVLALNKDLFDTGLTHNNRFQMADSVQGVFGIHYVTNPWMVGEVGMTDEKRAEGQRAKLFELMQHNGAVMVPFETKDFARPFDFPVLSEAIDDFMKNDAIQAEFRQTLPALIEKLGGVMGVGAVLGAFPDGSFQVDALEDVLERALSAEGIQELGGARRLQALFRRLFASYRERYDDPSEFSFSALEHAISLGRIKGVMPEGFLVDGKSASTPEDLWPSLVTCIHFEQFLERMFDEEEPVAAREDAKGGKEGGDIAALRDIKERMYRRENAKQSFARFAEFLAAREGEAAKERYMEMYRTVDGSLSDADLAGASDAVLRCFAAYDGEALYREFSEWRQRGKDAPPYLFFVFYDVFGRLPEGSVRRLQMNVVEKQKGTFARSTEIHHRIINAFANISINHPGEDAAAALYRIFDLAKDLNRGDQRMAEHIAQLSETLSFQEKTGGDNKQLLKDIAGAKKYGEFSVLLAARNREAAFKYIGMDYSKFSAEEHAYYLSIRKDLDELFSALIINKKFRNDPYLLMLVKFAYVAIIKGDFSRIKYDLQYTPSYIDDFFGQSEAEKIRIFLGMRKDSRGYRAFSSMARKGILKFWREDHSMVKGRAPESLDSLIRFIVKDGLERSLELAPRIRAYMDTLPVSKEERDRRSDHLKALGRTLDYIRDSKGKLEELKEIDAAIFERLVSQPNQELLIAEARKAYNEVTIEQRQLVVANFLIENLDPEKGAGAMIRAHRDTIAAAITALRAHPRVAALRPDIRAWILPDMNDAATILNFDGNRIEAFKSVIDDPEAWERVMKMLECISALKTQLATLVKKCNSQSSSADAAKEPSMAACYEELAKRICSHDNMMIKGKVSESFDNFIYSIVKDYIERSMEFAPKLQMYMAGLSADRQERSARDERLEKLERSLSLLQASKCSVEDLKAVDTAVFERIVSMPDHASRDEEIRKTLAAVSTERKLLDMANFYDEALDPDRGIEKTLRAYRDTIASAVAVIEAHPYFAALGPKVRASLLPDVNDIASIVNLDTGRIKPYEKAVNDPKTWSEAVKMVDAIKALKAYLADLAAKCDAQTQNAQTTGDEPLIYYYNRLKGKIGKITSESVGGVEIGNSGDPIMIMKALRGECYDYRDGLNSDTLVSMFFHPFIKVEYARKTADPDSFLANQLFILSEVSDENLKRVPVVTADFFYDEREYESELADMMGFYTCTPAGIELNVVLEHEQAAPQSGQISLVQNIIYTDGALDVFLDITNRMFAARMSNFERLGKTILQAPFTPEESRDYVRKNGSAQAFYDEHIAPRDNFQEMYARILSDIVSIPSGTGDPEGVNRVGDYMAARLNESGFETEKIPAGSDGLGDHLVFRRIADPSLPTVFFSGHMDTVYTGAAEPARAEIRQGKIFGPGVMDMKGGLVVMLAVIKKLEEEGLIDDVNIVGVLTSDEERGSKSSKRVMEETAGSYPTGLALVFEFNKHGEVILSRQGIGHFGRTFSAPDAAARLSGIVKNLGMLTDEESGDRVSAGRIFAIDPRTPPAGTRHVARYAVDVTSEAGHAGARTHAGNRDSNFETASKMAAVERLIEAGYGGHALVYHRFVKGGREVNQLSTAARWVFDVYADATLDAAAVEKLKADAKTAAERAYAPGTATSVAEAPYSEERVWDDPAVTWGDASASVAIQGEYRFALNERESALKARISEFLGEAPAQSHRPVMREHQLAKNVLEMIGYAGRGEFATSAAESNLISNMLNNRGERIPTFDGIGLTGDGAHSRNAMDEWALLSSLNERTDLALALVKQLLSITAHGEGMSLNSVRKAATYKEEELAILSMTRDYAARNKDAIFALQSSGYDTFESTADALIADRWDAGTAGNRTGVFFPAKWDHSYAAINERGEIAAALLAYERPADARSGTGDSVHIQYILVDPRYAGRDIERDLIIEAAKALNERGGYRTLAGRELALTCAVTDANKALLEEMGFAGPSDRYAEAVKGDKGVYAVSTEKILAAANEDRKVPGSGSAVTAPPPSKAPGADTVAAEAPAVRLSGEHPPTAGQVLTAVKGAAGRQVAESASVFTEASARDASRQEEARAIAIFSDNFIMDNVIPPYEMYEACKARGITFWVVVKNPLERQKIEALGFSEGVRFIEIGPDDLRAEDGRRRSLLASEYNLMCAEEAVAYMREKEGLSGKIAVVTNPFNTPENKKTHTKEEFGRVSARAKAAIIIPQIPMGAGSIVYADMLIAYAVKVLNGHDLDGRPLVILLPPIKNLNEHIIEMIERFNAERHVVFAA